MGDVVHAFGAFMDSQVPKHPVFARHLLVAGLRAFGLKLDHKPEKRLPPSRQYIASMMNHIVVDMLTHPERAALTSLFTPCELLEACGITPLCAELYSAFVNGAHAEKAFIDTAEQEGIAETFCSYHKVLLGSAYSGVLPKPQFVVNTSIACDANNLTFRALSEHFGIDQFYIDVPPFEGDEAIAYVADQLRDLKVFLEDHTHRAITDEALQTNVARSRDTIHNLERAYVLKGEHFFPGDLASELYEIYITHMGLGTEKVQRYSEMLLDDLEKAGPPKGLRILWVHIIPNWQEPIRQLFNYSDKVSIVACDLNFDSLVEQDPVHPYESMARRLVDSSFSGTGEKRIARAKEMAGRLHADGTVVFCHWGCKQTAGISMRMKEELEQAGYPTLILNGDGCDETNSSDEQVRTRMNAFIELLQERTGKD